MIKDLVKKFIPHGVRLYVHNILRIIYMQKNGFKNINTEYNLFQIGDDNTNTFFGYYDISPFNDKNELIYLEVEDGKPFANIVKNSLCGTEKKVITRTYAWNTQQGSRLRWFPGEDDVICFNDFVGDKYVNRRIYLETGQEKILDVPIYDVTSDGRLGVTLDFERLGVLRPGYGYTNRKYHPTNDLSEEGISLVDMNTGGSKKVLTYKKIAEVLGESVTDFSNNYINHLSFSPKGNKFLFFWLKNIPNWAEAALLTYDIDSGHIAVLEKELRVSHYTWKDNDTILCTAIAGTSIHNMQCRYYLYKEGKPRDIVGEEILLRDGHPTYLNKTFILTDTYPDRCFFQELFLYDVEKKEKRRLVYSFSVPVKDGVNRTDMHPRFNSDKSIICYDANVSGHRKLYILKNW